MKTLPAISKGMSMREALPVAAELGIRVERAADGRTIFRDHATSVTTRANPNSRVPPAVVSMFKRAYRELHPEPPQEEPMAAKKKARKPEPKPAVTRAVPPKRTTPRNYLSVPHYFKLANWLVKHLEAMRQMMPSVRDLCADATDQLGFKVTPSNIRTAWETQEEEHGPLPTQETARAAAKEEKATSVAGLRKELRAMLLTVAGEILNLYDEMQVDPPPHFAALADDLTCDS